MDVVRNGCVRKCTFPSKREASVQTIFVEWTGHDLALYGGRRRRGRGHQCSGGGGGGGRCQPAGLSAALRQARGAGKTRPLGVQQVPFDPYLPLTTTQWANFLPDCLVFRFSVTKCCEHLQKANLRARRCARSFACRTIAPESRPQPCVLGTCTCANMKQLTTLNGIHTVSLKGGTFEEERRCTLCEVHTVHFLERLCPSGKAVSCCTQPGASRWTFLSEVDPSCCKYLCRFRNGRAAWGMHHCHCRAELHSEDFRNHLRSIWIYHVHERQKRISSISSASLRCRHCASRLAFTPKNEHEPAPVCLPQLSALHTSTDEAIFTLYIYACENHLG